MPRIALIFGKSANTRLVPNSSIDNRWISARRRTFEPHPQLAGSVANFSTSLSAPQILQVKATTRNLFCHAALAQVRDPPNQNVNLAANCRIRGSYVAVLVRKAGFVT